jgi:hypothetical protein
MTREPGSSPTSYSGAYHPCSPEIQAAILGTIRITAHGGFACNAPTTVTSKYQIHWLKVACLARKTALLWFQLLAFGCCLMPTAAFAKCGSTNQPSYDDIHAIMFTQNGCYNTIHNPSLPTRFIVSSFDCSTFWVAFWESGPATFPTTYSQYNLRDDIGTFQLSPTITDARGLLKDDGFFMLSPPDRFVNDAAQWVLSVRRCAVITKIRMYDTVPGLQDPATRKLFDDLRDLVMRAKATRISNVPAEFAQDGLFNF